MKNANSPAKTTEKGSVAETGKMRFHSPVQLQSTLENHFENSFSMSHNEEELGKIIQKYQQSLDRANDELRKILNYILILLNATNNFQNSTTQDTVFKQMREGKTDAELQKILTNIETAFSTAEVQYRNITNNTHFQRTFSDCIEYSKKCVFKRFGEMKNAKDKIFDLYQDHSLKKILEKQPSPSI